MADYGSKKILPAKTTHPVLRKGARWGFFINKTKNMRVAVFIDGSNLYFKLKELSTPHTTQFDYYGLCQFLARQREIVVLRYYVGVVRVNKKTSKARPCAETK